MADQFITCTTCHSQIPLTQALQADIEESLKRRFAAEFAPMLSQGHGECSDPGCDCHTSEGGAADCQARSRPHTH